MTPKRDVQIEDRSTFNLLPLSRGWGRAGLHAQAARLAAIVGLIARVAVAAPAARWRIVDGPQPSRGCDTPVRLVGSQRRATALAVCKHVPNAELGVWEADKHAGAGRDRRLGAPELVVASSVMNLGDALASFRPREHKDMTGWSHEGPRASLEVLHSIRGLEGHTYHLPQSVAATIQGPLRSCSVLRTQIPVKPWVQHDRLDVTNVASLELVIQRLVMVERAVKLNPKALRMIDHALSEGRGVTTKDLTAHIAENEARILKQNQLLGEEVSHCSKVDGSGSKKQDRGTRAGKGSPENDVVRTGSGGLPTSAVCLWRGFSLLKGSGTVACQGGGDCAQLRRAVGEERCTRRFERLCHAGARVSRDRTFFGKTCGDAYAGAFASQA